MLNWRKTNSAIANGKFIHYAPQNNDVYVYFRYNNEQKVMVLLNKNNENVTLDMNRYSEIISNKFKAKDIISDKEFYIENTFTISGKTAMILEIRYNSF
ncbi:MAG: cyclomaltodextrinase C-terminal domain-containing protein [Melioribacteraceae bacterium]